jgi:hypothetical protein
MLLDEHNQYVEPPIIFRAVAKGFNLHDINLSSLDAKELDATVFPHISRCLDLNVATWIMSAAQHTSPGARPSGSSYFAQMDAPPRDQLQIVDGGASQFINANRHEFHDYEALSIDSRYKLRGVPATVYGIGTTKEVHTTTTGERISTTLSNVLHAPDFVQFAPHGISRLFSQGRAQDAGASFNYAQQCTVTLPS